MQLSLKSDYAARAVLGLARHYHNGGALRAKDIAGDLGMSPKYLPQILLALKSRGIIRSVRGMAGGYSLTRPPAEISLGEVLRAIEGPVFNPAAVIAGDSPPELRRAWKKVQQTLETAANAITFQQLLEDGAAKEEMYYI